MAVVIHVHALPNHPWLYRWLQRLTRGVLLYNSRKACCHFGDDPASARILMPSIQRPVEPSVEAKRRMRFVAAGAFVPSKHFHLLLEAFRPLRSEGLDTRLVIFGLSDHPLDRDYQQKIIDSCQGNDSIRLEPWTSDWTSRLASSDIFVHLGKPESFGIVTLEAFARGCRLVILADTFVDDLPEPARSQGVYRTSELSPCAVKDAMKDAAQGVDSARDLWQNRRVTQSCFSLAGKETPLMSLYRSVAFRNSTDRA